MRETCFVCPECSKHLSIDIGGVGLLCDCSECQAKVRVPDVAIEFLCDHCGGALAAEEALRGTTFQCPHCMESTPIPKDPRGPEERVLGLSTKIACPSCNTPLDYDDDFRREMAGRTIDCPMCKDKIMIKGTPTERRDKPVVAGEPVLNLAGSEAQDVHSRPTEIYSQQECSHCGGVIPAGKTSCPHCDQVI